MVTKKEVGNNLYKNRATIIKIIFFPLALIFKLMVGFLKTFIGFLDETGKESEKKVPKKKSNLQKVILFTNNGYRFLNGKVDSKLNSIIPKNMENIFGLTNIYHNLDGGESIVALYTENCESLDFSKNLEELKGERPIILLKEDKKTHKLKFGIEIEKFSIVGGKRLTEVSYSFINTIYMNLLRQVSDNRLRNTFIMGLLAGCLLGGLIFSLIIGFLT